jgi:hypothetical protein
LELKFGEPHATTTTESSDDPVALMPKKAGAGAPAVRPAHREARHRDSFVKLNPATMMKNPVMFVVEVGAA